MLVAIGDGYPSFNVSGEALSRCQRDIDTSASSASGGTDGVEFFLGAGRVLEVRWESMKAAFAFT